ncbi:MAG: flagellar basal body P-ring formation chaperone FlgA [Alphaproteobacteria bacterium]
MTNRSFIAKTCAVACLAAAIFAVGVWRAQAQTAPAGRPVLLATTPTAERVVVRDAMVTLGDLFAGLADRTEEAVAPAPAPGGQTVYDLNRLAGIAKLHGVAWQPRTWSDRVVIERASQTVGQAEIETALRKALQSRGLAGRSEIELAGKMPPIQLPAGVSAAVQIDQLDYDDRSGRFSATVAVDTIRLPVVGRAVALVEVPVLNRRFAAGEIIRKDDLDWILVRSEQAGRQAIAEPQRLIGQEVRRVVPAGQTLRASDLRTPLAVLKNGIVTMMLQTPRMQLTSKGKALEDGSVGDTVRIMNSQSKTVIEGVVTSMNTVQVTSTTPVAY